MPSRSLRLRSALVLTAVGLAAGGCSSHSHVSASSVAPTVSPTGPLVAPSTSQVQDAQYFTELSEASGDLATYMTKNGDAALKALLTDGSAFCAFLARGGGIDNAMYSLAQGAQGVEATTHLPSSVETFNAIDAVSLLVLCPSEQKLIPADDQARLNALSQTLAGHRAPDAGAGSHG